MKALQYVAPGEGGIRMIPYAEDAPSNAFADPKEFASLVSLYQDRVFQIAWLLLGNATDARAAVRHTFLRAYRKRDSYTEKTSLVGWLYRISIRTATHIERRRFDNAERPSRTTDGQGTMQRALSKLPIEYRVVLVLKDIEGMTYNEMAKILRIRISAVRARLHRARLDLRDFLAQ